MPLGLMFLVVSCLAGSIRGGLPPSFPFATLLPPQGRKVEEGRALPRRLQQAVSKAMAGKVGTALVLDVRTQRLLAAHRLRFAARKLARPGSSIKPFTLLAALESGKVNPSEPFICPRLVRVGERRLDCGHPRTGEALKAETALAYSCNAYFAHLSARLTDSELTQAFARAGLTTRTGLAEDEVSGFVRESRSLDERQLLALGEGEIALTPLALLAAYRRLALLVTEPRTSGPALDAILAGLEGSVSYGMGRFAQTAGTEVAGKTGTASTGLGGAHAWFAGFAPARSPEIVVVVFLERGRGGPDAAPVAAEIFAAYAAGTKAR